MSKRDLFTRGPENPDDYVVETFLDKKGRKKEKVVYNGAVVRFLQAPKYVLKRLVAVAVLSVLSALIIVSTQAITHGSQNYWAVLLPTAAALFPSMYIIMGISAFQFNAEPMSSTRYKRSIIRVFRCSAAMVVFMAFALLGDILYRIFSDDWIFLKGDIAFPLLVATALVLSLISIFILRSVEVDERELILQR